MGACLPLPARSGQSRITCTSRDSAAAHRACLNRSHAHPAASGIPMSSCQMQGRPRSGRGAPFASHHGHDHPSTYLCARAMVHTALGMVPRHGAALSRQYGSVKSGQLPPSALPGEAPRAPSERRAWWPLSHDRCAQSKPCAAAVAACTAAAGPPVRPPVPASPCGCSPGRGL